MKKFLIDMGFGVLLAIMLNMIIIVAGASDIFIYNNF